MLESIRLNLVEQLDEDDGDLLKQGVLEIRDLSLVECLLEQRPAVKLIELEFHHLNEVEWPSSVYSLAEQSGIQFRPSSPKQTARR